MIGKTGLCILFAVALCHAVPLKEFHKRVKTTALPANCANVLPTKTEWESVTVKTLIAARGSTNTEIKDVDEILSSTDNDVFKANWLAAQAYQFDQKCNFGDQTAKSKASGRCAAFTSLGVCANQRLAAANTALNGDPPGTLNSVPVVIYGSDPAVTYTGPKCYQNKADNSAVLECGSTLDNKCVDVDNTHIKLFGFAHTADAYVRFVGVTAIPQTTGSLEGWGGVLLQAFSTAGGVKASFLPWNEGACTFMVVQAGADAAFTTAISGCHVYVATKLNSPPLLIHANANAVPGADGINNNPAKDLCATHILSLHNGYAKSKKFTTAQFGDVGTSKITAYGTKTGTAWTWKAHKTSKANRATAAVITRIDFVDWT